MCRARTALTALLAPASQPILCEMDSDAEPRLPGAFVLMPARLYNGATTERGSRDRNLDASAYCRAPGT